MNLIKLKNFFLDSFDLRKKRILKRILSKYQTENYHESTGKKWKKDIDICVKKVYDTHTGKLISRHVTYELILGLTTFRGFIFPDKVFSKKELKRL